MEIQAHAGALERHAHKVAHGFSAVGSQHKGVGLIGLQHAPHALHILPGETPVALGIQVAQLQHIELAQLDLGHTVGDLARDKLTAAQRALVVEQNAAAAKNVVALAVVHRHPVGIQLGHTIGAARVERGRFLLRNRLHLAKHLRGGRLVEANLAVHQANGFQQIQRTHTGDLGRGAGLVKTHTHKTLRCQVVDLVGLHLLHHGNAGAQVGQVIFDQMQIRVVLDTQLLDPPEVDRTAAAKRAIDLIALLQQQLRKVGAILSGDACQ